MTLADLAFTGDFERYASLRQRLQTVAYRQPMRSCDGCQR